jgi:iron complex transport system permease protein
VKTLGARVYLIRLGACLAVLAALVVMSPGVGTESRSFGWSDVWRARLGMSIGSAAIQRFDTSGDGSLDAEEEESFRRTGRIYFDLRMARTMLALAAGVTLALSGATLQVLFRNPLATPYTLGIASGGSLGALIAMRCDWDRTLVLLRLGGQDIGVSSLTLAAFAGGLAVVLTVLVLARGARKLTSNEFLLAGVTMGLLCSALMMMVTFVSTERQTFQMIWWMMGSLDTISTMRAATMLPILVPAWAVLVLSARSLNQHRLGDELAASRGVNLAVLQTTCVLTCTVATATVVAYCGPIGFVGLVVPHIVALLCGSDCRVLLPAAGLVGGAFVILCDWGSQWVLPVAGRLTGREYGSAKLPIGVVTAVVGVPVFLILLRLRRR